MVSDAVRRVLALVCSDHVVTTCTTCHRDYTFPQLGFDLFGPQHFQCPSCGRDVDTELHLHILSCPEISALIAERVERGVRAVKDSQRLSTQSAVLAAESDELARRVLDTTREISHVPGPSTAIERIARALLERFPICADCISR